MAPGDVCWCDRGIAYIGIMQANRPANCYNYLLRNNSMITDTKQWPLLPAGTEIFIQKNMISIGKYYDPYDEKSFYIQELNGSTSVFNLNLNQEPLVRELKPHPLTLSLETEKSKPIHPKLHKKPTLKKLRNCALCKGKRKDSHFVTLDLKNFPICNMCLTHAEELRSDAPSLNRIFYKYRAPSKKDQFAWFMKRDNDKTFDTGVYTRRSCGWKKGMDQVVSKVGIIDIIATKYALVEFPCYYNYKYAIDLRDLTLIENQMPIQLKAGIIDTINTTSIYDSSFYLDKHGYISSSSVKLCETKELHITSSLSILPCGWCDRSEYIPTHQYYKLDQNRINLCGTCWNDFRIKFFTTIK